MLLCNHQYEWFENFLQMFCGFLRDLKLIFKLILHINTYNKTNMMLKHDVIYLLDIYRKKHSYKYENIKITKHYLDLK